MKGYLDAWGVPYTVNPEMVRGLDYYSRTTFEMTAQGLGAQDAVAAGGRYDGLVESFGGPPTPGLGFALGMERLVLILPDAVKDVGGTAPVYIAALGDEARKLAMEWAVRLRGRGIPAALDYEGRSLKSQMRRADRLGAGQVVILGDDELKAGKAQLRNMTDKAQREVGLDQVVHELIEEYK